VFARDTAHSEKYEVLELRREKKGSHGGRQETSKIPVVQSCGFSMIE